MATMLEWLGWWKLWSGFGLILNTLGALLLLPPFIRLLERMQLALARDARRNLLQQVDTFDRNFSRFSNWKDFFGVPTSVSSLKGFLTATKIGAPAINHLHQRYRSDFNLPERSLLRGELLDRDLINHSCDEIEMTIRLRQEVTPQDLYEKAAWLIFAGFALQLIAVFFA